MHFMSDHDMSVPLERLDRYQRLSQQHKFDPISNLPTWKPMPINASPPPDLANAYTVIVAAYKFELWRLVHALYQL